MSDIKSVLDSARKSRALARGEVLAMDYEELRKLAALVRHKPTRTNFNKAVELAPAPEAWNN